MKQIKGKNVLVVGHRNTTKYVVNGLFERDTLRSDIADNDFVNLYTVKDNFFKKKNTFLYKNLWKNFTSLTPFG